MKKIGVTVLGFFILFAFIDAIAISHRRIILCFHLNELNFRGTTTAVFDYADQAGKLLGHRSFIIYPQSRVDPPVYSHFRRRFRNSLFSYSPGSNTVIGGEAFEGLVKKLGCEVNYVIKYGTKESEPVISPSLALSIPTVVHGVFALENHDNCHHALLNKYLPRDLEQDLTPILPHIVKEKLTSKNEVLIDYRQMFGVPNSALLLCSHGGENSFSVGAAEETLRLLSQKSNQRNLTKEVHFLFMGTKPPIEASNVHRLNATVDAAAKESYFAACDAMLHARTDGETFGLAVAEFSIRNKPVLTFSGHPGQLLSELEHLRILGPAAFLYNTSQELIGYIQNWASDGVPKENNGVSFREAYRVYSPEQVMATFKKVVLDPALGLDLDDTLDTLISPSSTQQLSYSFDQRLHFLNIRCDARQCDKIASDECSMVLGSHQYPSILACPWVNWKEGHRDFIRFVEFHPIGFAIHPEDIVTCAPVKVHDFSQCDPANRSTYIYGAAEEAVYRRNMAHSYFGFTNKKAGWDAMRHYELIAAGSMPYFYELEKAPRRMMPSLPRDLLLRGRALADDARASFDSLNRTRSMWKSIFDRKAYDILSCCLNRYARDNLTSTALARSVLATANRVNATRILMLFTEDESLIHDYLSAALLHGLKSLSSDLMGSRGIDRIVVEYPADELYYEVPPNKEPFEIIRARNLWGSGFSWAHRLRGPKPQISRAEITRGVIRRYWDLIIYPQVHRGMPLWEVVQQYYGKEDIILIDSEDFPLSAFESIEEIKSGDPLAWPPFNFQWREVFQRGVLFKRELDSCP